MRKLIDKTIHPMSTVTNLTPGASVTNIPAGSLGNLPIGYYRGSPAFWDLDKAVVQPLVRAEREHIMGILNGRLEGYDLRTVTYTLGDAIGTTMRGRLTVPAGQVWFVHGVSITAIKDATAGFTFQWRCSLWPDIVATGATPDADGQGYFATAIAGAANTAIANHSLFGLAAAAPATNSVTVSGVSQTMPLRLPGGTVLTLQVTTNTAVTAAATPVVMALYGYVGKALVS